MNIKENSVLDIPKDDDKLKRVIEIERELGESGVYKGASAAEGRVRRALFTYFKAYWCVPSAYG